MSKIDGIKAINEAEVELIHRGHSVRKDTAEKGRQGRLLSISTGKHKTKIEILYLSKFPIHLVWQPIFSGRKGDGEYEIATPILRKIVTDMGYRNLVSNEAKNYRYEYKDVDSIEEIISLINENGQLLDSVERKQTPQLFAVEYDPALIAKRYFYAFRNKDQHLLDLCRDMLSADRFDYAIAINRKTEIRTYREHLVPCIYLHREIIRRIQNGATKAEIANLIKDNLRIAYINPKDADHIDIEANLKMTMPEDWGWGNSVTARLDKCNVNYRDNGENS